MEEGTDTVGITCDTTVSFSSLQDNEMTNFVVWNDTETVVTLARSVSKQMIMAGS